jgi:hypothetical protein
MYGQSLKNFWEVDEYPPNPQINGAITAELTSSINILIDYSIKYARINVDA